MDLGPIKRTKISTTHEQLADAIAETKRLVVEFLETADDPSMDQLFPDPRQERYRDP